MSEKPILRMDIAEFQADGYLQEANRLFFHPLGLALEIVREDDGSSRLGGVWDYREDPEGMFFGVDEIDNVEGRRKASMVNAQRERLRAERTRVMGSIVQPIGAPFLDQEKTNV
jgi:hypothetical protein